MDWQTILSYTQKHEESIIFKSTIQVEEELGPLLIALANTKGGKIIIGFDNNNFHLSGTDISQDWIETLITEYCSPLFGIEIEEVKKNDKTILCLSIQEGSQKPYVFKDVCYILENGKAIETTPTTKQYKGIINQLHSQLSPFPETQKSSPSLEIQSDSRQNYEPYTGPIVTKISPATSEASKAEAPPKIEEAPKAPTLISTTIEINPVVDSFIETEPTQGAIHIESTPQVFRTKVEYKSTSDLNHRQKNALDVIIDESSIRNKTYRSLFGVSHKTAHLELVDMVAKGYVESKGSGRSTCYVLPQKEGVFA